MSESYAQKKSSVDLLQPPDLLLGARAPLQHKSVLPRQIVERVRRPRLGGLRAQLEGADALVDFLTACRKANKNSVSRSMRRARRCVRRAS